MATVYLARDVRHGRYVALKRLTPELATAVGVERFQREIQVAASLQHPNILPVHDSGEAAGALWYTMPYVDGESLRERLRRETRLPVDEAVGLACEVADALDCAHGAGIVHRDIKPENIMLSGSRSRSGGSAPRDGVGRVHALVADFGIARAVHEAGATITSTGLVIGTPAYMSPEQGGGLGRPVDARSDIYSLGCVLYEMLAGERPIAAPTPHAMLARRLMEAPPDVRLARPVVPAGVAAAVGRALAVDPEDRFGSAGEFAAALTTGLREPSAGTSRVAATAVATTRLARFRGWRPRVAVALLLVSALAAWILRRAPAPSSLDETLLAVAPFDVLEPSLALWHEGLMDVLSRTLDGAGQVHTVSPAVIAHRWQGRADHASAVALGHATGAARVLYGAVIPAGPDSVRLTAALHDARTGRTLAEFDLRGPRDRVDRLADSLTMGALRALAPPTALAAPAGSPVGTASPPALKAFLEGEQHFRRSQFDSAQPAFRRAVTLDSGFGLAWHRLSQSIEWRDSTESFAEHDPETARAAFRAAAAHGLSPRDSLVLTADSLFWGLFAAQERFMHSGARFDEQFWDSHTRLFRSLDEAVRRFPQDPEVVLARAEAGWQWGGIVGRPFEEALGFYDRAIALDSAFSPSYPHAAFMALGTGDTRRALGYVEAHLRWAPSGSVRGLLWLLQALLTPGDASRKRADRLLDSLPVYALSKAWGLLGLSTEPGDGLIRVLRALERRNPHGRYDWTEPLASTLAAHGRLRELMDLSRRNPLVVGEAGFVADEALPRDLLERLRAHWRRTTNPYADPPPPFLGWLAAHHDTVTLAHLIAVADSTNDDRATMRAFLTLAREDTAGALIQFRAFPDSALPMHWNVRLTKAKLFRATGHLDEAARTLRPTFSPWASDYLPGDGLWQLERGRTYEALGDSASARRAYQTVVSLWRHADPVLQPLVSEARDAVRRLERRSP